MVRSNLEAKNEVRSILQAQTETRSNLEAQSEARSNPEAQNEVRSNVWPWGTEYGLDLSVESRSEPDCIYNLHCLRHILQLRSSPRPTVS